MKRAIQIVLLALLAIICFTKPGSYLVKGQEILATKLTDEARRAEVHNDAVERELERRRRRNNNGNGKGRSAPNRRGKGNGKGKGMSSKSSGKGGRSIRFLPPRIDPIPFVNCIPLPAGLLTSKSKSKSSMSGKGKGGKGSRSRSRRNRRGKGRLLMSSSSSRDGNRRRGNRNGARNNGRGNDRNNGRNNNGNMDRKKMMRPRLPYCPAEAPTFFPTTLPTFTPFPTSTPVPTATPFPTVTSVPDGPTAAPTASGPTTPPAPTTEPAPSAGGGGAPVATPAGTERILVESSLEYGFFAGTNVRQPTQAELDGLIVQTSNFYDQVLRAQFPNLESFEAVLVEDFFDAANTNLPVKIDFDANAFFTEGTTVPSVEQVLQALEDANYETYIMEFVWNATPMNGLFFDTQRAAYEARVVNA